MIIYADGSEYGGVKAYSKVGFANVAVHSDGVITNVGTHNGAIRGSHEDIAFVEACRLAWSMKCRPEDLTIVSDDEFLGWASYHMHRGNYSAARPRLIDRIGAVCNTHYGKWVYDLVLWYMESTRTVKVNGHRRDTPIYHRWADYNARCAVQMKEPIDFNAWLANGFFFPTGANGDGSLAGFTQFAPFTATVESGNMSYD